MGLSPEAFERLVKIVGEEHCSRLEEDRVCYAYDATRRFFPPEAVVFPANAREVSAVLKLANELKFYVTPRGAGSGMSGGSLPVAGGVAMVMTRFDRILDIDTDNLVATVQPGVITGVFQRAVEKKGLFYPPDPSSADFSTLGGNAAECAGGARGVKYGVTRDYVIGMEVVLPTGEIVSFGVNTAKGVVGYDLARLIVGSEGTLGVITQLALRLLPLPEASRTLMAVFDRMETAAKVVADIIRQGIIPRALEYMDNAAIRCVEAQKKVGLPVDAEAVLLIEVDGTETEAGHLARRVVSVMEGRTRGDIRMAKSKEEAALLWQARKAISPALRAYGTGKLNEDIVVPRSRIPEMVAKIREMGEKTGLTMVSFGHAGDGNIHFNVMFDREDAKQETLALSVVEEVFDYTLALGGSISGEHGVGVAKAPYMAKEISPDVVALMKRIKHAFDPAGILNPGKMLL